MQAGVTIPLTASLAEFVRAVGPASFAIAATVLGVVVLVVMGVALRARHRMREDVRAIVHALEELRTGRGRGGSEIESRSRMRLVADAVQRLGADLHSAWSEAETAAARWRAVTDAAGDTAVVTTDVDGDIRSMSTGASKVTGWDEGEVLSRPAAVLFEESAYKELLPKLARRSLRDHGVNTRSAMLRRDGSRFEAEVSVRMLAGPSKEPVGFMLLFRDITAQVRIENELRAAEQRYRGLVEGLGDGVLIVKQGRIAYANAAAGALCGSSGPELTGTVWRDRVSTGDVLVMEGALESVAAGSPGGDEVRCTLVGPEGEPGAEVRIKVAAVSFGGEAAVMLLVRDETVERRLAAELRHNETRLDAVLEATSDGVLVLAEDQPRSVQMTNHAFAAMFGLRVQDLLGASEDRLARLLHEAVEGAGTLADRITDAAPEDGPTTLTVGRDEPREIQVTLAPLSGRRGERLGCVVACRDVTERRRSERDLQAQAEVLQLSKVELEQSYRKLHDVNQKLESRGEELDRLNQELQRLDQMKSDLIGNVSHELQTPLVSIRGYTEMILKERLGPISEEQRKGLSLSLKNIDRLIAMIDNLLAVSRADPALGELKLSPFRLRSLIDEAVALLEEKIRARGLRVTVRLEREAVEIRADHDRILQVFLNLLSNAVKFSHEGGEITIAAEVGPADYVTVHLSDGGVGIPEEHLGRIFERHFQVRRTPGDEASGSGIGLSIVRDILRLHGCTIHASSEEDRGARFTFTLPLGAHNGKAAARAAPYDEAGPTPESEAASVRPEVPAADAPGDATPAAPPATSAAPPRSRLRIIRRPKK